MSLSTIANHLHAWVCEIPDRGFEFMGDVINSDDPDVRWMLK